MTDGDRGGGGGGGSLGRGRPGLSMRLGRLGMSTRQPLLVSVPEATESLNTWRISGRPCRRRSRIVSLNRTADPAAGSSVWRRSGSSLSVGNRRSLWLRRRLTTAASPWLR